MSLRSEIGLALLGYGGCVLWYTWPLARVGADHLVPGSPLLLADAYYLVWVLSWMAHALSTDPTQLFRGNVGYPAPYVVTGTETLLGLQPLFGPLSGVTGNPVLAYNAVLFVSFVACALAMHFLVRAWTGSAIGAVVAALAFTFAPWRSDIGRPYLLQMQYVPLLVFLVDRALEKGAWRSGAAAGLLLGLQILTSIWVGYMAVLVIGLLGVAHLTVARGRWPAATWRAAASVPLAALPLVAPIVVPYAAALRLGALEPPDPMGFAARLTDELFGAPRAVLAAYAGWGPCVAGSIGILALARSRRDRARLLALCLCALAGLGMAAGPTGFLDGSVAPARWLAAFVPGFDRLRAPVRFGAITGFALSTLAGCGVAALMGVAGPRRVQVLGARVTMALVSTAIAWPLVWRSPPASMQVDTGLRVPAAYRWLAVQGRGGTLLELPIGRALGIADNQVAARAMYMSTYHWLPLINAHSGFPLPSYELTEGWAEQLPAPEALRALGTCTGLQWILVHRSSRRLLGLGEIPGVALRGRFPSDEPGREDLLYEVTGAKDAGCIDRLGELRRSDGAGSPARGMATLLLPSIVTRRADQAVTVRVNNGEARTWAAVPASSDEAIRIRVRWMERRSGVERVQEDIPLPVDVPAGRRARFTAWLQPPANPGYYWVETMLARGDHSGTMNRRRVRVR